MQNRLEKSVETVQIELMDAFSDLMASTVEREKMDSARKKLQARRAIEQHYEMRALRQQISDGWLEER